MTASCGNRRKIPPPVASNVWKDIRFHTMRIHPNIRKVGVCLLKAGGALTLMLAVALAAAWLCIGWTDEGSNDYAGGVVLCDAGGEVLRVSLGEGDVDCRPYYAADPDDWVVKALVASEDGTFWKHCGVRPLSVLRATFQNLFYRRRISGASTITMQAVRLIRPHPKTLWWKFKEAVMALKMERAKDKRWILSQYLNRAPFGSNFIGVEAAANGWFGKGAKQLGLGEAAMLAGMVQAPSRFRPDRGFERAIRRRDYVLGRMKALGMITDMQMKAAQSVRPVICRAPRPFRHPYFCDWALRHLGRDRAAQRKGGDYVTTLDADIQATCENVVNEAAGKGGYSVAAVVMRVDTGAVTALACSGDYFAGDAGQVNTALAPRPAGSTLKPFLVAHALDRGFVTPEERLADIPTAFKGYRPANFDARHRGLVTVRDALVLSLNIPFVRLLKDVGLEQFGGALRELGFANMKDPDETFGLGMAIGNVEVAPIELVSAYGAIARGGIWKNPCAFAHETAEGQAGTRVFSTGACWLVSDMLSGEERSAAALGHVADVTTSRFAWKTGTSAAYRDAWTVAWNPEYVVGVWCGHVSGGFGDKTLVGVKAAAPLAWRIARSFYPRNDGPWFVEPGEVTHRRVCSLTGLPANADCPATEDGRSLVGRSRSALCPVHCRDLDGKVIERIDALLAAFSGRIAAAGSLAIARPEDGATFSLVQGGVRQRIVCHVAGNPDGSRLWWFVDGAPVGESVGLQPFAIEPELGKHVITCATAEGVSATVTIHVESEAR